MFRCTSPPVILARCLRSTSMSAPFLPITTPGRAVVNGHAGLLRRAFDHDARDTRLLETATQIFTQREIFVQQLGVVVVSVPTRVPRPVDAEA